MKIKDSCRTCSLPGRVHYSRRLVVSSMGRGCRRDANDFGSRLLRRLTRSIENHTPDPSGCPSFPSEFTRHRGVVRSPQTLSTPTHQHNSTRRRGTRSAARSAQAKAFAPVVSEAARGVATAPRKSTRAGESEAHAAAEECRRASIVESIRRSSPREGSRAGASAMCTRWSSGS
jgi:hypothetical protein